MGDWDLGLLFCSGSFPTVGFGKFRSVAGFKLRDLSGFEEIVDSLARHRRHLLSMSFPVVGDNALRDKSWGVLSSGQGV